jgi:hypothetical protein
MCQHHWCLPSTLSGFDLLWREPTFVLVRVAVREADEKLLATFRTIFIQLAIAHGMASSVGSCSARDAARNRITIVKVGHNSCNYDHREKQVRWSMSAHRRPCMRNSLHCSRAAAAAAAVLLPGLVQGIYRQLLRSKSWQLEPAFDKFVRNRRELQVE